MLRREFLGGVFSYLAARVSGWRGTVSGTPVQTLAKPTESVQALIDQVHVLAGSLANPGFHRAHIQAIEDQIKVRLLLAGRACIYEEEGRRRLCALDSETGSLWTLPVRLASLPWARKAWADIGLAGLEDRLRELPRASEI